MAYNLRKRSKTNVQPPIIDIYDDPMDVPVQKMSFSVYQWKSSNEAQMSYGIGDIGVADGKFIEIFEVQGGGPIYKGKVLNVSISNEFYSNPI